MYIDAKAYNEVVKINPHKEDSISKTMENLTSLIEDLRKEGYAIAGFENAMIEFVKSATNLTAHWENLPRNIEPHITMATRYPFHMSFDEIVYEMQIWLQAVQSRIQLWKEGKLDATKATEKG